MKYSVFILPLIAIVSLSSISMASAAEEKTVVDHFKVQTKINGCDIDMKQHCRDVTPGKNRQVLCLMAHEDQLLESCKIGLVESAVTLQMGVATLDYAHSACESDRVKVCGNVEIGEGRLNKCLRENASALSSKCMTALQETGIWDSLIEPSAGSAAPVAKQ